MKFKILSILVILGMLAVMPMIYMGKVDPVALLDGNLGGLFGSSSSEFAKLKAEAPKNLTNAVTDEKVQVYKWRDENGVMQFSNTPPPDGGHAQQVELNPNHAEAHFLLGVMAATDDRHDDQGEHDLPAAAAAGAAVLGSHRRGVPAQPAGDAPGTYRPLAGA